MLSDISHVLWTFVDMVNRVNYETLARTEAFGVMYDATRKSSAGEASIFVSRVVLGLRADDVAAAAAGLEGVRYDRALDGFRIRDLDTLFEALPVIVERHDVDAASRLRRCLSNIVKHIDVLELTNQLTKM